jgi:MSHA biogenesis protein MshM
MYRAHFGLREPPFGLTPDTAFAYLASTHQQALNVLLLASASGEGFIKITGDVGFGKTLLCRHFMSKLGESVASAYIPNPMLDFHGLLLAIAEELGVVVDRRTDRHQLLKSINHALLGFARRGKRVFLIIDEAQAMPLESLEALRLLSNLETEKRKLVQVVMFGQPELDEKLAKPAIRQLRQRISFQYQLNHLSKKETGEYVAHRLRVAGYSGEGELFSSAAIRAMYRLTQGVPRLINVVAHKAMLAAYGEGKSKISRAHVVRAARDTPSVQQRSWLPLSGLALATLGLAAAVFWYSLR